MALVRRLKQGRIEGGKDGGYILTRGVPRYAQLSGRHFAVGRGVGYEYDTIPEAYAKRDELLAREKAKRAAAAAQREAAEAARVEAAQPEAAAPPCMLLGEGLTEGARVRFRPDPNRDRWTTGRLTEIRARCVVVTADDGGTYLRAPGAVALA